MCSIMYTMNNSVVLVFEVLIYTNFRLVQPYPRGYLKDMCTELILEAGSHVLLDYHK
jgi:hypothetical protein